MSSPQFRLREVHPLRHIMCTLSITMGELHVSLSKVDLHRFKKQGRAAPELQGLRVLIRWGAAFELQRGLVRPSHE